ncbi:Got1/Sft2-like family [Plasmodiophora brassicae]|uniref:Uncharacterized protein n=1 Tax=Plasmodiophora brassicae TaxID=37360 RepID=A0A0G4IXX6_PLABS|nr:hypothetical protein PBRA_007912 [Plasmodiophora brassicae]SPQ98985.1 unnamed protein product [Plasmodiophora brassicae]
MLGDNRKLGIGLTGIGSLFLVLGILLLFDKALLAMGNILFLCGVILIIGVRNTARFFYRKGKIRGTCCFLGGIALVLCGWPVIGIAVELFGMINLFGNFFPVIVTFLRSLPVIGPLLNMPGVSHAVDRLVGHVLPTHSA